MSARFVLALAGGVGGGKFARGLTAVLPPDELAVVVNTADDFVHLGLHICPDIDSVLYAIADLNDLERVYHLFPRLKERESQKAGTLSGGEQQMLAMGRALMGRPQILLLDEPSMGLSPILVEGIFSIIQEINAQGTTVLLVEQNALMALSVAHRGYVLQTGEIVLSDSAENLRQDESVRKAYLGE